MNNKSVSRALALVTTVILSVSSVTYAETSDTNTRGNWTITTYDNGDASDSFGAVNN